MRVGWKFVAFATLLCLLSVMSFAATDKALIYGTVVDLNGKPLPGVRVVLTSDKLKFVKEAITDSDGGYTIPDVSPTDDYILVAYRDKNPIDSTPKFELSVGDERMLLPPLREHPVETVIELPKSQTPADTTPAQPGEQKKPAAMEVKKIVVGAARMSNDASMAMSGVIKDDQLRGLPLFNRNFLALGLLTAQTHDVENGSPLAGATFSIAGNRPISNMFLLDGLDNVARSDNQAIPFQVNEAVQEFRVVSSTPNAEYGGQSGGVVNIITKRGTTAWHGSGFGYFSKDALNSNSPLSVYNGSSFDSAAAYAGPTFDAVAGNFPNSHFSYGPTNYNDYAATARVVNAASGLTGNNAIGWCTDSIRATSGAGLLPCATGGFGKNTPFDASSILSSHNRFDLPFDSKQFGYNLGGPLVKDKWFVFGSYEGTLIDNPTPILERVPSTFDRTYNPVLNIYGSPTAVSSATGRYFSSSDPNFLFANNIVKLFPQANVIGVPGALEFFQGEAPNYTHVHNGLLRLDTAKTNYGDFSIRYVAQALNQLHDDTFPTGGLYPGNGAIRDAFNQSLMISNSRSIGSNWVFDTRAGFSRFRVNETAQDAHFNPQANGINMPTSQMMTVLLSGIDPQVSGASPGTLGANSSWMDSYWDWTVPIFSPCSSGPNTPCPAGTYKLYNINGQFPTLDGQFPMMRLGAPLSAPGQRRDTTVQADENVSFRHGRHLWKMGGGYRNFINRSMNAGFSRGLMVSSNIGEFTSDSESSIFYNFGAALPGAFRSPSFDFALRQPQIYRAQLGNYAIGGYIQDSWRVSTRVTLNGGLRYDFFSTPQDDNNQLWNYDPKANGLVQENSNVVVDPYGNRCASVVRWGAIYQDYGYVLPWACSPTGKFDLNAHRNGIAPRAGFAWDLRGDGNTMIRAGVGYMVDQVPSSTYAALGFNRPTPVSATNPQMIYGRVFPQTLCFECGLGNTTVNPSVSTFQPRYQAASSPMSLSAIDSAHTSLPRTRQISFSIQQKVASKTKLEVGYVGTHGMNLPTVYNASFQNEFSCVISCDNTVPVFTMANRGESTYHSLMTRLSLLSMRGFSGNVTYVYSKALDNVAGYTFPLTPLTLRNSVFGVASIALGAPGGNLTGTTGSISAVGQAGGLASATTFSDSLNAGLTTTGNRLALVSRYNIPQDPINYLRDDYGLSDFNTSHRFVLDYAWDVPFLRGSSRKANVFGNWRVSAVITAQTGQPFTVFAGPIGGELTQRAHVIGTPQTQDNPNSFINVSAFALPASTTSQGRDSVYFWRDSTGTLNADATCAHGFGQVAPSGSFQSAERNLFDPSHPVTPCIGFSRRNEFVGPGLASGDLAIQKAIQISERQSLNLRAEFFNITNRANYYNPISELSIDGFNLNNDFGKIKSAKEPRQIQLAIRYSF